MSARDYEALALFLAARAALPFDWGRRGNDCGAFAGGAVLAQTGHDPLIGLRWSTQAGALRLIVQAGGLGPLVAELLQEVPPALAQRGDIALARNDVTGAVTGAVTGGVNCGGDDEVLMVVEGQTLIGPGNTRAPRSTMLRAFAADAPVLRTGRPVQRADRR